MNRKAMAATAGAAIALVLLGAGLFRWDSQRLLERTYDVADLLPRDRTSASGMRQLEDIVEDYVAYDTWQSLGGPGSIEIVDVHLLKVCQRRAAHRSISALLSGMRAIDASDPTAGETPLQTLVGSERIQGSDLCDVVVYSLANLLGKKGDFRSILEQVADLEPDAWSATGGVGDFSVYQYGKIPMLVVVNSSPVQEKVAKLLAEKRTALANK